MGIFSASSSKGRNAAGAIIWLTVKSKVREVATTSHIKPHPTISPHSSLTALSRHHSAQSLRPPLSSWTFKFPLPSPEMPPGIHVASFIISFSFLIKCHLIIEALIFIYTTTIYQTASHSPYVCCCC